MPQVRRGIRIVHVVAHCLALIPIRLGFFEFTELGIPLP